MKKYLIAILAVALVSIARADNQSDDYARFEKWMRAVQKVAPSYNLKLDGNEAEEEFFYLYCWQSDDHSIVHAIKKARDAWNEAPNRFWTFQYRCYVQGKLNEDGFDREVAATEEAARKKFEANKSGCDCRIINVLMGDMYP